MKKIFVGILAIAMGFASCNKGNDDLNSEVIDKGAKFVASVGMDRSLFAVDNGEMSGGGAVDDSKTINDNDLIGIQIFKADDLSTPIASGVFTGFQINNANLALNNKSAGMEYTETDLLNVELEHSVDYVVESTLIKNGKFVESSTTYGIPFGYQENTVVSEWTTTPYTFDFTGVRNHSNRIIEQDRWYSKKSFTADYGKPEITINLRRISFMVNFYVYNLGVKTSVIGAIYTGLAEGVMPGYNFPLVTSDMCITSKTINIGTKEIPNNITVDVFAQEGRIFTMPDITNAYSCVEVDGQPSKEMDDLLEFGFGVGTGTDWIKPLRFFAARFNPIPNHCYNIYVDANTNAINVIGVSLVDEWDTTPIDINTKEENLNLNI